MTETVDALVPGPPSWEEYELQLNLRDPHGITQEGIDVYEGLYLNKGMNQARKVARKYGFQLPQWIWDKYGKKSRGFNPKLRAVRVELKGETGQSWGKGFSELVRKRRNIRHLLAVGDPWNAYEYSLIYDMPELRPVLTAHAPWLNGQAVAYRNGVRFNNKWHWK